MAPRSPASHRAPPPSAGGAGGAPPPRDWGEPTERLEELYRWVERGALRTAAWYLADRVWKRRGARALRAGTAVGAVAGTAVPLLDLTGVLPGATPFGYLALLLAVACVGVDRCFGMTSGWMRDVATAQAVQRRLQALQFEWASEGVREVLGPTEGTAGEAAERCLGLLRRFSEEVTELVRVETGDWMVEFRTGVAPLGMQGGVPGPCREGGGSAVGRIPSPPSGSARPNMPRQRPPEAR
ncbi:SLATT domain-containing protein [Streptomyces sp. NPDC059477]|uniref:SLATT domain-containing protein n=1 Tax=Streptomyces sp. NPDC059477 TaxID=3346847 RepID=UPI003680FB1D